MADIVIPIHITCLKVTMNSNNMYIRQIQVVKVGVWDFPNWEVKVGGVQIGMLDKIREVR